MITSISESELTVDALRLPGCLLPTDDRSMSGGSSDREADPRVSDCCVGLCNRDDLADWRDQAGDAGDMPSTRSCDGVHDPAGIFVFAARCLVCERYPSLCPITEGVMGSFLNARRHLLPVQRKDVRRVLTYTAVGGGFARSDISQALYPVPRSVGNCRSRASPSR